MFLNILKITIRNLIRQRGYTLINILGLAIGLASSILIALYVINEVTYDRFHKKAEQIYRIGVRGQMPGNELNQAVTSPPMMEALLNDYPEVEMVCRIAKFGGWLVTYEDKKFNETDADFKFADSTFFQMFDFKLLRGDPKTVLTRPKTLVMTETAARKYFGDEDPIGKTLKVEQDTIIYEVTGLMEDVPVNSHFHFNMLGSMSSIGQSRSTNWLNHNFYTYILLRAGTDPEVFTGQMRNMVTKYVGPLIEQFIGISLEQFEASGSSFGYFLQPLLDIHLHSDLQVEIEPNGNPAYVYIFSIISVLILIIACINFMNLATARSITRAREVGLRKVVGSHKSYIIGQFLAESVIMSLLSLLLAVFLVYLLLPQYNNLIRLDLRFDIFKNFYTLPLLIMLALFVGFIAGSYPSFVLSSFNPVNVLKGEIFKGSGKSLLRSILVVIQFTVSISILTGTFIVYKQLAYMQKKDLGFKKNNVLVIRRSDALRDRIDAFKQELVRQPGIISVGNATHIPSSTFWNNAHWIEGRDRSLSYLIMTAFVSCNYADVLGLEMKEGRFFSPSMPTDSFAVVINEATVKSLELTDPLSARFYQPGQGSGQDQFLPVIGVVKDFHYESMHEDIHPMIFHFMPGNWEGYIVVKLEIADVQKTVNFIQKTWEDFTEQRFPFEYFWLEDEFSMLFEPERRTGQILLVFSILSIFISCLGLLGLISFSTAQRTKEVGIRKATGASTSTVMFLLSRETIKLLAISSLLSIPVYFGINRWLQNFAYRIDFNPVLFVLDLAEILLAVLLIALITVSYVSYSAAIRNPAESLRIE
jgi:putative ABC transport system permease protein